jgi:DNA modification methylase
VGKNQNQKQETNKMRECDRPVHDWYRFVLSYPPHLVQDVLDKFSVNRGSNHTVLDPFSGTGTTTVECQKLGIPAVGIEANAIAHFAGRTKLNWEVGPDRLRDSIFRAAGRADEVVSKTLDPKYWRSLPEESDRLLLKHSKNKTSSICPLPLHKALVILQSIDTTAPVAHRDLLRLAVAKALVSGIGNVRFGPEVGVTKAKGDVDAIAIWLKAAKQMVDDIQTMQKSPYRLTNTIHNGDARNITRFVAPASIDAVITSPPYPNEKDYTRTTRLEAVMLGYLRNKADLRAAKEYLLRSNTRNVFAADTDDTWVVNNRQVQDLAIAIEQKRIALGKTSGFERLYTRATKLYFGGMARHLAELRQLLRPGAQLAYVVGDQKSYLQVHIKTGEVLAEIAKDLGYKVVGLDKFRDRAATAISEQITEEILFLQWG